MKSIIREMLSAIITSRIDTAMDRVNENPEYSAVCKRQGKAKNEIDRLFERFSPEEKTIIQNYEEGETHRETFEIREVYAQGLRDCFILLSTLSDSKGGVEI